MILIDYKFQMQNIRYHSICIVFLKSLEDEDQRISLFNYLSDWSRLFGFTSTMIPSGVGFHHSLFIFYPAMIKAAR